MKIEVFKAEDFIEPICIGEMKSVFDRIALKANEVLLAKRAQVIEIFFGEELMSNLKDWEKLRFLSFKLRSLGHLIETQDADHVRPDDIVDVQYGLSHLINEISSEVRGVSQRIEEKEIKSHKNQ